MNNSSQIYYMVTLFKLSLNKISKITVWTQISLSTSLSLIRIRKHCSSETVLAPLRISLNLRSAKRESSKLHLRISETTLATSWLLRSTTTTTRAPSKQDTRTATTPVTPSLSSIILRDTSWCHRWIPDCTMSRLTNTKCLQSGNGNTNGRVVVSSRDGPFYRVITAGYVNSKNIDLEVELTPGDYILHVVTSWIDKDHDLNISIYGSSLISLSRVYHKKYPALLAEGLEPLALRDGNQVTKNGVE